MVRRSKTISTRDILVYWETFSCHHHFTQLLQNYQNNSRETQVELKTFHPPSRTTMHYQTLVSVLLAVVSVSSSAIPATPQDPFNDLDSCLDYAASIADKAASIGFSNGCRSHFGGEDLDRLMARSFPLTSTNISASPLDKRDDCNGDPHGACCCELYCTYTVTCPACATGCVTSCETKYGADCAFNLATCQDGSCIG